MKKQATFIILIFLSLSIYSQTKEELEYELSYFTGGEKYSDKIDIARKLLKIDSLNYKAIDFIYNYYNERQIDSVSLFFEELKRKHSNKAQVFLLGAELISYYDWFNKEEFTNMRIEYLASALKHDKDNKEALFRLAETYYIDYIRPLYLERNSIFSTGDPVQDSIFMEERRKKRESFIEHSEDSALKYFYVLWDFDSDKKDIIYFPIRQLECYLNKKENNRVTENIFQQNEYCYFPPWYFFDFPKNWECDYSYNYLSEVEISKMQSDWLEEQLIDLKEPCLYSSDFSAKKDIYRFTWLRSFDNPISIRVEKTEDEIHLIWKIGKGSGGYKPQGLKKKGKKKLSKRQWNEFMQLVKESQFDNLPNQKYVSMFDGASWTLEHKTNTNFKAHETNEPSDSFKECCLFLLDLSGIRVKKDKIY